MGVIAKSDVDLSTGPIDTVLPCDMELSPRGLSTSKEADVEVAPELGASFPILSWPGPSKPASSSPLRFQK
jgi:hypothetical protein